MLMQRLPEAEISVLREARIVIPDRSQSMVSTAGECLQAESFLHSTEGVWLYRPDVN